ncbi:cell wall-binding repeat-containing protein [Microbacterium sp. zg.Y909]|uniref:cell wall-binding repeat-containing protein n=1 Tax=Microbacterium sp. zg.Y909 TaxID=2969413 RepID=UPI00214AD764|nr:cell wall-binding repeat-containing protein [Microbacterium sp. zg.Y909]MCR2824024.1 cell wall-binding repeat-containing protein [Microbacterium sp. zg.Y909]
MPHPPERRRRSSKLAVLALAGVLVGSLLGAAPAAPAQAAGSIFDGGMIISDAEFFDGAAMTAAQVQAFLNEKNASCVPATGGPACIKDFTADLPAMAADRYCKAVPGKARATAAEIIAAAGQACGISQKVLLVMLQKEQGLITRSNPTQRHFDAALGQSCPDTAPCDPRAAGFVNQIYLGARQQQLYVQNPGWYNYRPGRVNTIQWHPDRACGTSQVYIENQATANLYIYTPYRPNIAALAAGIGTGDDCSAYGNRNFYNYYQQWFKGAGSAAAKIAPCTVPPATEIAARGDKLVVTADSLNARTAPTTACGTGATSLGKGTVVQASGTYGAWTRASVNGQEMWLTTKYLSTRLPLVAGTPSISGKAVAGQILTAATGTWSPTPASFSYQWSRDGKAIAGATASTYRVTNDDATRRITVTVTANIPGYDAESRTTAGVSARGFGADRLSGQDRYETAVEVSRKSFPNGAQTVYLVVGTDFADALAAAPLAAHKDAPLLLTRSTALPASTEAELKRLAPTRVVLIGGTGVIDSAMAGRLRTLLGSGLAVDRVGGSDRYETARFIAAQFDSAPAVYVATGRDFADALGAAAVAGGRGAPVILVKGENDHVDQQTIRAVASLGSKEIVIVGGEGVVSRGISDQLASQGLSVTRYGGLDRYATNAALNNASFGSGTSSIVLATGRDFPDALTGAVLAGERRAPIFVNRGNCVTGEAADFLLSKGGSAFTLVGGDGVMSAAVGKFQRC